MGVSCLLVFAAGSAAATSVCTSVCHVRPFSCVYWQALVCMFMKLLCWLG
jgi:hypothetical protein